MTQKSNSCLHKGESASQGQKRHIRSGVQQGMLVVLFEICGVCLLWTRVLLLMPSTPVTFWWDWGKAFETNDLNCGGQQLNLQHDHLPAHRMLERSEFVDTKSSLFIFPETSFFSPRRRWSWRVHCWRCGEDPDGVHCLNRMQLQRNVCCTSLKWTAAKFKSGTVIAVSGLFDCT